MLSVVGLQAVGFSAVTGALAAEGHRRDVFGLLVLALVTSLGGMIHGLFMEEAERRDVARSVSFEVALFR